MAKAAAEARRREAETAALEKEELEPTLENESQGEANWPHLGGTEPLSPDVAAPPAETARARRVGTIPDPARSDTIPVSQGGSDHIDNRQAACELCHREKSQREALAGRGKSKRPSPKHPGLA